MLFSDFVRNTCMCVQERVVINILHGLLIKVTFLLITYISSQFFSGNTLKMQVSGYLYVLVKYISFFPFTPDQNNNNNNNNPKKTKKTHKTKNKQNQKQKQNRTKKQTKQKSKQKLNLPFLAIILIKIYFCVFNKQWQQSNC